MLWSTVIVFFPMYHRLQYYDGLRPWAYSGVGFNDSFECFGVLEGCLGLVGVRVDLHRVFSTDTCMIYTT